MNTIPISTCANAAANVPWRHWLRHTTLILLLLAVIFAGKVGAAQFPWLPSFENNGAPADTFPDIVLHHQASDRVNALWYMNGMCNSGGIYITKPDGTTPSGTDDKDWKLVGTGKFHVGADNHRDLLWRHVSLDLTSVWYLNEFGICTGAAIISQYAGADWKIGGTGDFDGDGYTDIMWYNPTTGGKVIWWMTGITRSSSAFLNLPTSNSSKVVTVGDFNNDNVPDIVMYDDAAYTASIAVTDALNRNPHFTTSPVTYVVGGAVVVNLDNDYKIVEAGDFDRDGNTDLLFHHETIGLNSIWPMIGTKYRVSSPNLCDNLQLLNDTDWKYISQDPQRSTWRLLTTPLPLPLTVTATITGSTIKLTFNITPTDWTYKIERKPSTDSTWPAPLQTGWTALTWTDTTGPTGPLPGTRYDYRVKRVRTSDSALLETVVKAAMVSGTVVEKRGKALIIVDTTLQSLLNIDQLRRDLVADGWDVPAPFPVPRHVDYTEPPPVIPPDPTYFSANNSANIGTVRGIISSQKGATGQTAVILIGHVPVPYSGLTNSDGHSSCSYPPDHVGAWASDLYYATVNSTWHDSGTVNYNDLCTVPPPPVLVNFHENPYWRENSNYIPGDGKFDEDFAPGQVDVAVGRIDFARLVSFTRTEANLINDYLTKAHNYRYGLGLNNTFFQPSAVMLNNFSFLPSDPGWALNGLWASYTISRMNSIYGPNAAMTVGDPYRQPQTKSFMWGFSAGPGQQNSINSVSGNGYFSANLATTSPEARIGFYVLHGSYFGDFNKQDDFMRATIATPNSGLAAIWGINRWALDSMSLGDTLGSCLVRTANALGNNPRELAIMGDPTLRLPATPAPANLVLAPAQPVVGQSVTVTWNFVSGLTYKVYSSTSPYGPFGLRGTFSSAPGTYTESATGTYYMVRAFFNASTPASGTYVDIGIGAVKP